MLHSQGVDHFKVSTKPERFLPVLPSRTSRRESYVDGLGSMKWRAHNYMKIVGSKHKCTHCAHCGGIVWQTTVGAGMARLSDRSCHAYLDSLGECSTDHSIKGHHTMTIIQLNCCSTAQCTDCALFKSTAWCLEILMTVARWDHTMFLF